MKYLSIRISISAVEDEELATYLYQFKGHDRTRKARALLRAGLAVVQGKDVFTMPVPVSDVQPCKRGSDGESLALLQELGINPMDFAFAEVQNGL